MSDEDDDWFKDELVGEHSEMKERLAKFEWRPIETAPKDGTKLLLWAGNAVVGQWYAKVVGTPVWSVSWNGDEFEPTHWMPLPEPPADFHPAVTLESQSLARE